MLSPGAPRLLLVEFLTSARLFQERSAAFPFVRGFALGRNIPVRHVCFGYDPAPEVAGRFRMTFTGEEERTLREVLEQHSPTHVLLNELLEEEAFARLKAHAPRAAFTVNELDPVLSLNDLDLLALWLEGTGPLMEWLREKDRDDPDSAGRSPLWRLARLRDQGALPPPISRHTIDHVTPDYQCELMNDSARRIRPLVQVLAGPLCFFHAPLGRNPAYRGIALDSLAPFGDRVAACAFCSGEPDRAYRHTRRPEELALAQLVAAHRTTPRERFSAEFLIRGAAVFARVGRFFEALLEARVPPSQIYFYCRFDEVLKKGEVLESFLPRLEEAGHVIHLFAMGAENFSAVENERLNKGLAPETVGRAILLLRGLERAWPRALSYREHGGLSFILMTPWTTLDDLEINFATFKRLELPPDRLLLTSRLQIFDDRGVALLARRDGVLAEEFEDPAFALFDSGCVKDERQRELPWRFQDRRVSAIYSLLVRTDSFGDRLARDPLHRRMRTLIGRLAGGDSNLFALAEAILAVARVDGPLAPERLLERAERLATERGLFARAEGLDHRKVVAPTPSVQIVLDTARRMAESVPPARLLDEVARSLGEAAGELVAALSPAERRDLLRAALAPRLERVATRVRALIAALKDDEREPLCGFRPEEVAVRWSRSGRAELHVALSMGEERLRLFISPLPAADGPRLLAGERFGLVLDRDGKLDTTAKRCAAERLLWLCESHLDPSDLPRVANGRM